MRRLAAALGALTALLAVAGTASAAPLSFPADAGFSAGTSSWTPTSACGLLCTTSGTVPSTGGNPGGYARAQYSTVANVIGTAGGSVDFTSSAFGWTGAAPRSATVHLDRRAAIGTLLSLNGAAAATVDLVDLTASRSTTIKAINYPTSLATWAGLDVPVPTSLLIGGHTYELRVHTTFSALVAVVGGATVDYDNVGLTATRAAASFSGTTAGAPSSTSVSIATTLDTAGVDATYHVEYGTTTAYGSSTPDATLLGADSPGAIGASLTGLTPGTTYHARIVATTDAGTSYGPDVTFTTAAAGSPAPSQPAVGTVMATPTGARGADLSAMVDLQGATGAQYRFEYGTSTSYGSATALTAVPAAGANGWSVLDGSVGTLAPGTTYHVRAALLVAGVWTYGDDITFATPAAQAPAIGAPTVTATDTTAQVSADITPNSSDAQWSVEWGTTTAYGSSSTPVTIPAGSDPVRAVYDIGGLLPDTDYHVRVTAVSADGTTYGRDAVVHTAAGAGQIVTVVPGDGPAPPSTGDEDGGTIAAGTDDGATTAAGADQGGQARAATPPAAPAPAPGTPATTPAPSAKGAPTATPAACRAVTILARSRGIKVAMERFVTAGAPLAITPRATAKNPKKVTVDGKPIAAARAGRAARLSAAQLRPGRHVIVVGTGANAARLKVAVGACAPALTVRSAGGVTRVAAAVVPGTTAVTLALPKAYIKTLGAARLTVRVAGGKTKVIKIVRSGAAIRVQGLPANVTEVRLTLRAATRLPVAGVTASVVRATRTARLKARPVGTRPR